MSELGRFLVAVLLLAFTCINLQAQVNIPRISPDARLEQMIGLTKVEVKYSRPSKRGRQILGEIIPYDRIWRVGANESTKVSFSTDVVVDGKPLEKGTYALYAFPHEDSWEVVFHKDTTHWGDGRDAYNPEMDALRFKVIPKALNNVVETFRIDFQDFTHTSASMVWQWENFQIDFKITVDTDPMVLEDIRYQIEHNPTAETYYEAAKYMQERNKKHGMALTWLAEAERLEGPKYYIYRVRALVLGQMHWYKEAIEAAEVSAKLAKEENKDEFVRLAEGYIEEWQKLIQH